MQYRADHLDGLRGLAAIVVLVAHIVQIFWIRIIGLATPIQIFASQASSVAVVAFFVLSGFVIAASAEANAGKNGRFLFREFVASRIARIYPPFLVAVVISLLLVLVVDYWQLPGGAMPLGFPEDSYFPRDLLTASPSEVLHAMALLQGLGQPNGSLWSLYIEVKVYFVFSGLFLLLQARRYALGALILLASLYFGIGYNPHFFAYAACWFVGSTFYYAVVEWTLDWRKACLSAAALGLCVVGMIASAPPGQTSLEVLLPSLIALGEAVIIGVVVFLTPLRFDALRGLGSTSYSLYVLHFPILLLVQSLTIRFAGPSLAATISASLVAFGLAYGAAMLGSRVEDTRGPLRRMLLAALPIHRP